MEETSSSKISQKTYKDDDKYTKFKSNKNDDRDYSLNPVSILTGRNSKETAWKIKFIFAIGLASILRRAISQKKYCLNYVAYRNYAENYHNVLTETNYTNPIVTPYQNVFPETSMKDLPDYLKNVAVVPQKSLNGIKGQFSKDSIDVSDDFICCYRDPNDPYNRIGRPFPNNKYVNNHWYKYMSSRTLPVQYKMDAQPQLITGFSANHFHEHITHVPNIKEKFPGQKVVVYDIGLEPEQVQYIKSKPEFYIYEYFDFQDYPPHISILKNYAWKTLIWAEALPKYGAVLWFDTSIYFTKNANEAIKRHIIEKDTCWIFFIKAAAHDIASFTHPKLWGYFPSNFTKYNTPEDSYMKMAGAVIIYDTDKCRYNILKWAILCALTEDCIAPKGSRKSCPPDNGYSYNQESYNNTFDQMKYDPERLTAAQGDPTHQKFEMCHRFDQAVTSILVENFNRYDQDISWLDEDEQLGKPVRNGYHRLTNNAGEMGEFIKGEVDEEDKERSPDQYEDEWEAQQNNPLKNSLNRKRNPLAPDAHPRSSAADPAMAMEQLLMENFPPSDDEVQEKDAAQEKEHKVRLFSEMWGDNASYKAKRFAEMWNVTVDYVMAMNEDDWKQKMKDFKDAGGLDTLKETEPKETVTWYDVEPDENGKYPVVYHPILRKQKIQKLAEEWGISFDQLWGTPDDVIIARKKENVLHANDVKKGTAKAQSGSATFNTENRVDKDSALAAHRQKMKESLNSSEEDEEKTDTSNGFGADAEAARNQAIRKAKVLTDQDEIETQANNLLQKGYFASRADLDVYMKKHGHMPSEEEMENIRKKMERYRFRYAQKEERNS